MFVAMRPGDRLCAFGFNKNSGWMRGNDLPDTGEGKVWKGGLPAGLKFSAVCILGYCEKEFVILAIAKGVLAPRFAFHAA